MDSISIGTEDRAYCFGDFRLLPGRQLLLCGDRPVRLGTRALDLLRLLVERPGELVTKTELIRSAWPDTFVHESNLKVNIAALRRALSQAEPDAPYVATVPGRGYRFVAPVRLESAMPVAEAFAPVPSVGDGPPGPCPIIGRDDDIAEIAALLASNRFLTIVGPAGVGKTTVAMAAARRLAGRYPDGICFVDLAAIGDPRLVTAAVASAIGSGGNLKDVMVGIVDALRGRRLLLIFDNCEHVLAASSMVADQIRATAPDTTILATSREPFRTRAETVYRLQPLPCPDTSDAIDGAHAVAFPAVALFVTRAGEAAGYRMSDADAPVIARICRSLDGIPLAIELAAPRLLSCDPATLLQVLQRSFELLGYGPSHAPIRQQTLLATLDWSYRLLSGDEAALLRLLSVFAGAFTLQDVVGVGRCLERSAEDLAACLENLAGKSLLSATISETGLQYRLLDITRHYAGERLRVAAEQRRASASHAGYLLGLFERAEAEWQWRVREEWTATYGRRANDLRRAIDWAFGADGDPRLGVRLTAVAIPLWDELSSVGESRLRVQRALQSDALDQCDPVVRMKLATAYAWGLTFGEHLDPEAEAAWRESLRLAELTGSVDYQLRTLWGLAALQSFNGRHRQVLASLRRFGTVVEREGDGSAAPDGERLGVMAEFYLGDVLGAQQRLSRLAHRHDSIAKRTRISRFQMDRYIGIRVALAIVTWVCGRPDEATALAQAALDGASMTGHVVSQSNALAQAAIPIALWTGQVEAAERHLASLIANLNQRGLAIWGPFTRFYDGMIRHERGDAAGLEQMRGALEELVAHNVVLRIPMFLSMLAEAALQRRRTDLADASVAAAISHLARQEEAWCRPEVLRVSGLVQWQQGDRDRAERTLLDAIEAAGRAGALSFELRAVTSLAECLSHRDRSAAAALLDPACRRFDPSSRSRDVANARRLLDRLRMPHDLAGLARAER